PFSVLLSTPVAVFGAFFILWLRRTVLAALLPGYMVQIENDVYSQIGLVMLIGLAAKNAILIVEFAKDEYEQGKPLVDAALEGARLRLRPILMTYFAFILGSVPLWTASGAGAVARQIMGTTVIGGMLAASLIGVFFIPVIFYQDEQLCSLLRTALQQNYDLRVAGSRILQAQAQLGITRADQFPSVNAGAGISDNRSAKSKFLPAFEESTGHVKLSAAWELDFWGKYRRATEAARANLLSSEAARQEVMVTLVATVAGAYFQLRALDLELEISKRTLASRQESLRLTSLLADRGSTSMLDVRQAEQLVFTAAAEVPALEQVIAQEENLISILLGKNPDDVPRGHKLTEQAHPLEVPAGLPSSLLERRPDIRAAEQQLIAANAQIGVAKAAYFPQISLSGSGGFQTAALTNLFTGPSGTWNFGAAVTQPVFTAGKIRSNVRLAEAQQQTALLFYQQTIQGAFRSVADALIAYRKTREFRNEFS